MERIVLFLVMFILMALAGLWYFSDTLKAIHESNARHNASYNHNNVNNAPNSVNSFVRYKS